MKVLRRFVVVGAIVTIFDFALTMTMWRGVGLRPWLASLVGVGAATAVSFVLHRAVSFAAEPARRWYKSSTQYLAAVGAATAADVIAFSLLFRLGRGNFFDASVAKIAAITCAFSIRMMLYRSTMMRAVRGDQASPAARPLPTAPFRLSVVIPAFRESERIGKTIQRVREELSSVHDAGGVEVIVVDDGSEDDTPHQARRAGADQVIELTPNAGKGAAVRAGMLAARGKVIGFTDVDLAYSPRQFIGMCEQIELGWDVVVGSRRHLGTSTLVAARRLREVGGRIINMFTMAVLLGQYRDTQCGIKAFRGDVARLIFEHSRIDGFAFDVEVFHLIERYRLTLIEVPVEVENSERSTVKVIRDAARLIRDLFKVRKFAHTGEYECQVDQYLPAATRV